MLNQKRTILLITGLVIIAAALTFLTIPVALAQGTGSTAIVGQVTVGGVPTNGVLVTCNGVSNTTATFQGQAGVYIINGLPDAKGLPFQASYGSYPPYVDTVDLPGSGQQYYQIPTVDINTTPAATATPTPVPNATVTPAPNATITPTPAPNASVTPAPNATVTPTPVPNATVTPAPNATAAPTPTVAPAPVPQAVAQPPAAATAAPPVVTTPPATPTPVPKVSDLPTPAATLAQTPSPAPAPTQTKSPGFVGILALTCMLGAAYLVLRKKR